MSTLRWGDMVSLLRSKQACRAHAIQATGEEGSQKAHVTTGNGAHGTEAEQEFNFTSGEKAGTVDFSSETLGSFPARFSQDLKLSEQKQSLRAQGIVWSRAGPVAGEGRPTTSHHYGLASRHAWLCCGRTSPFPQSTALRPPGRLGKAATSRVCEQ